MSRREPRASAAGAAQKDALHEFEQFKKKFLLANKHITKLNSSLSTRCQELETLVATLNSENLRLHATMLSLYAELKREKEKTIQAMAALERTTMHALVQTFGNIRHDLNIPHPPPKQDSPARSPPKVRRPDPSLSPHANRLAQAPNFSQIAEEDEGMEGNASPTPSPQVHRRRKSGGRSSASSSSSGPLTSATRVSSTQPLAQLLPAPQIVTAIHVDIDDTLLAPSTRKRIARRQSGLIGTPAPVPSSSHSLTPPRPPSPAFGSPLRRAAGLAEEEEENGIQDRDMPDAEADVEDQLARAAEAKKEKRRRLKALSVQAGETEGESEGARERDRDRKERDREKERRRSRHEADEQGGATGPLFSLKDVTNIAIGQGRSSLPPLEIPLSIQPRRYSTPEDSDVPTSAFTTSTRPTLTTPGTTPGPSFLPTPRTSSPPPIPHDPSPEPELPAGGRERRVRRSVNYAEPKLNTKMRKPDPAPEGQPRRSSTAAPRSSAASRASSVTDDVNVTVKRKRSRPQLPVNEDSDGDGDDDDGAQADEEYMPSRDQWAGGVTRRRSTQAGQSRRAGSGIEERRHSTLI